MRAAHARKENQNPAALLYLVAEELLLEAHETEAESESAFMTAAFFLGFLAILIANMLM